MTASTKQNSPSVCIVGISGGSGSGKTYFARALMKALGQNRAMIISQDSFYIDQSRRFDHDGGAVNFDHPDSLDFDLLAQVIDELRQGNPSRAPIYDFVTHSRSGQTKTLDPVPIVLIDGTLIFHSEAVRPCLEFRIFFDTPESLRFERRLRRDVEERGRTPEGVHEQFQRHVKPMHDRFVQPSIRHAHEVVCGLDEYALALEKYTKIFRERIDC